MADVSSSGRRGQMILVSGLALALAFVALVLILNSAVYTENLATRSDDVPATDALAYREDTRDGVGGAIEYVNQHDNASGPDREARKDALEIALNRSIDEWNDIAVQHAALGGRAANVSRPIGYTWGTQVGQNGERAFTNASANPTWNLTTNVSEVDRFHMNVNRSKLTGSIANSTAFTLEVTSGNETWTMYVLNESGSTDVRVTDFDGSGTRCLDATGTHTEIDIVSGTVGGQDCLGLDFPDDAPTPYDIEIENGDSAVGTYELVVDSSATPTNALSTNAPYVTPVIRAATVELDYESPSLRYESTMTVEPHDPGTVGSIGTGGTESPTGGGTVDGPPKVTSDGNALDCTENTGNRYQINVTSEATAADNRTITSVEVRLYDPSGNLMSTQRQSFDSSSVVIDTKFNEKIRNREFGAYRVAVTAYDDEGQQGTNEWTVNVPSECESS